MHEAPNEGDEIDELTLDGTARHIRSVCGEIRRCPGQIMVAIMVVPIILCIVVRSADVKSPGTARLHAIGVDSSMGTLQAIAQIGSHVTKHATTITGPTRGISVRTTRKHPIPFPAMHPPGVSSLARTTWPQKSITWLALGPLCLFGATIAVWLRRGFAAPSKAWDPGSKLCDPSRVAQSTDRRFAMCGVVGMHVPPDRHRLHAPTMYQEVLALLHEAVASGVWPTTSSARARLIDGCGLHGVARGASFTVVNPLLTEPARPKGRGGSKARGRKKRGALGNKLFPALAEAVFRLEAEIAPRGRPGSAQCVVNYNTRFVPHVDMGSGAGGDATCLIVALGDYVGGGVVVEGQVHDVRYSPLEFDGWRQTHWTEPFIGDRFSLVWYTPTTETHAVAAARISRDYDPPIRYRPGSTDENVVVEVLGPRHVYAGPARGDPRWPPTDFSPRGHVVLDVGAHIGAFTRYALEAGASRVLAFEPEPENAALLCDNATPFVGHVQLFEAAVVHGGGDVRDLVLGRDRSDGVKNTWRHALAGLTHYQDSARGEGADVLQRVRVATVPLFGPGGVLTDDVTFVKLDCEGAELELLLTFPPGGWRNVQRLVFEWSFTKNRSMDDFRAVVARLESEGFQVMHEGVGHWDQLPEWPWNMDAVVFAARDLGC